MPKVIFVEHGGARHEVDVSVGRSVMQAATENSVPGIIGDCGGNCACATCHVYIDGPWRTLFSPPSKEEAEMLDCALHIQEGSRLSCQVIVTAAMDGIEVGLPESQT